MQASLIEKLVYEYMDRVERLGLPKGKLTIDDGWDTEFDTQGRRIFGNWNIDRNKFPHMEELVKDMISRGFIPGLWFSPFIFTVDCELAKRYPELVGESYSADPNFPLCWRTIGECIFFQEK